MSRDFQKAKDIFLHAIEQDPNVARDRFLDEACAGNLELRGFVVDLLDAHCEPDNFLGGNQDQETSDRRSNCAVGQQIGPYKLLEIIGEGGMGTVYMAEQTEPVLRRVALKLIKTGMDTRQVIARFEAERQTLAVMDHPNIAKVLDAGSTELGRPYFVMELVKGKPITKFCDEQQLDTESRLRLFQEVCHGVQHAHQKGIIHRDIKPSNVLVAMYDDRPVPKVIDFGVAKATAEKLTEKTMFTRFGQIVGTLEYMSPEQAQFNQLDIDTRSDIYSLGAVLYELLAGEPPFDREKIKEQALDETLRMIREDEPTKPSTKLSSAPQMAKLASNRQTSIDKLGSSIRGDLDWIVMKALEKDRSRRYETANGLANDVQRFLDNEPVIAAPPNFKYRIKKYVRRNRTTVIAASCIGLALVLGVLGTSIGFFWVVKERNHAETRLAQVAKGNEILTSIFRDLNIGEIKDGPDPLEAVLALRLIEAGKQLDGASIGDPLMVATMEHQLSESLESLGFTKEAIELGEKSLAIRSRLLGLKNRDTLESMCLLGGEYGSNGQADKAISMLEKTLDLSKETLGTSDEITRDCMDSLANVFFNQGRVEEAQALVEQSLDLAIQCSDRESTFVLTHNLAYVYLSSEQFDKSLKMFEEALALKESIGRPDDVFSIKAIVGLGTFYSRTNQFEKAISYYEDALQIAEKELGSLHPTTLSALQELTVIYWRTSQLKKSVPLLEERVRRTEVKFGPNHHETQMAAADLAINYRDAGRLDEAGKVARDLVELRNRDPDQARPLPVECHTVLASILARQRQFGEAEKFQRKGVEALKEINGPDDNRTLLFELNNLGQYVLEQGRCEEAERLFAELIETNTRIFGANHKDTVSCMVNIASALRSQHRFEEAESFLRNVVAIQQHANRQSSQLTLASLTNLAANLESQNKLVEAEKTIRKVFATAGKMNESESDNPKNIEAKVVHARIKERQGKYEEAEQLYSSALQELKRVHTTDHPDTQKTARLIGIRYGVSQNWKKATEEFSNLNPDIAENLYCQAISLLGDKDIDGYRRLLDDIETRFGNRQHPSSQYAVVWTNVLQPIPDDKAKNALDLADSLVRKAPLDIHRIALAATQVRCQKVPEGIENLKKLNREWETAEHKPASYSPATIWYFLSMANLKQGDIDQAQIWLDRANKQSTQESQDRNAPSTWDRRLVNQILRAQVERMIAAEN